MPLAIFVILLLAVRLGSCQLFPNLPTTRTTDTLEPSATSGSKTTARTSETGTSKSTAASTSTVATTTRQTTRQTTTAGTTTAGTTTAATTASATTAATTSASASQSETEATTVPTTAATTSPTSAGSTINPERLDNTKTGWWYIPGKQGQPATLQADVLKLINRYDVIWQEPLSGRKVVYLTMDEGYEYEDNTTEILNTAKVKGVPITFFITGSYLENNPDKVIRMAEEGHLVANHTTSHPNLVDLVAKKGEAGLLKELHDLETAFQNLTGQDMPRIIRPPEGSYSERVLYYLSRAGYQTVFWSFAYRDWITDEQPDPAEAKAKILGQLHNGSVILIHAVSDTNVAILPDLIDGIRARGYEFALLND